ESAASRPLSACRRGRQTHLDSPADCFSTVLLAFALTAFAAAEAERQVRRQWPLGVGQELVAEIPAEADPVRVLRVHAAQRTDVLGEVVALATLAALADLAEVVLDHVVIVPVVAAV